YPVRTGNTDRAAALAAEHGPALADLAGGELQRMYLAQLGTLDDFAQRAGRLEWAVEELLSILELNPHLTLTVDQTRVVQRARDLTQH
ncbi:MAG: hypothetical protein ACRDQ5_04400, partial [Sciscionella sp.]